MDDLVNWGGADMNDAAPMREGDDIYLIALGSNMRHHRYGLPRAILLTALQALEDFGVEVLAMSPIIDSAPVGPSMRRYANAAAVIRCDLAPEELLNLLKGLEHAFDRKQFGQRWRSRTLDLDIVLWGGGSFKTPGLTIPHKLFSQRPFVLSPAVAIAPNWRDPSSGLLLKQLLVRLTDTRPVLRGREHTL